MLNSIGNLEKLMTVLEDFHDGAILCNPDMTIRHANQTAHAIFAYETDQLIGSSINILIPGQIRKAHAAYASSYFQNPEPRRMNMMTHLTGLKKDGHEIHLSISLKPVNIDRETLALVIIRDVEEIVQLEAKLFHAQKMEAIGKTSSGIVHDLNNILQIISTSSFLAKSGINDETREFLDEIDTQTELASNMLRYLLTYLKEGTPASGCVDLEKLINSFRPIAGAALPKKTQITFDIQKGNNYEIYSTPTAVSQLLLNLIVNAKDALQETKNPKVQITLKPTIHGEIDLIISDNGCGMDEKTRKNAFKSYFTTKKEQGTGLGLATVYGIILDQGGQIDIESTPGKGSSFIITLPDYQASRAILAPLSRCNKKRGA